MKESIVVNADLRRGLRDLMGVSKLHGVVIRERRGMLIQPAVVVYAEKKSNRRGVNPVSICFFLGFVPFCKRGDEKRVAWSAVSLFAIWVKVECEIVKLVNSGLCVFAVCS